MKSIIQSEKHYVQASLFSVGIGAIVNSKLVESVAVLAKNLSLEVEEGSIVKAIFLEYWITSDDATQGSVNITVEKRPSGAPAMTYANSQALNSYSNKKNILYISQGLTPPNVQSGIPLIRQWIKLPKGKQRMGLGDQIVINFAGITNGANICGFATYKEYK